MKKTILFDLDGTLVDSGPGITKCAQYALDHFGIHEPESSCKKILEHFSILSYFDEVTGAEMNGPRNEKVDVLIEALRRMEKKPEECVLIGDTRFDAIGAAKLHMECIGVSYGYGTAEELLAEGAKVVLPSMKEVERYLVEHEN